MSGKVEITYQGSSRAPALVALAHGAGAGMDSPFMQKCADGLADRGLQVARFEFPYMQKMRQTKKRRPPDRLPVLMESWHAVITILQRRIKRSRKKLVIGGKSMGGRIASLVAREAQVAGLLCLGFPFHPPGKPVGQRIKHLRNLTAPTLIVQGERDPFGTRRDVARYRLSPAIRLHWLPGANHSFKTARSAAVSTDDNMARALDTTAEFVRELS